MKNLLYYRCRQMSMNGIKTAFWGPQAWGFLFSAIAGAYPVRVDPRNKDHLKIVKAFERMLTSLVYTLPCFHCRLSYKGYLKELPIANYSLTRRDMMKWLYLLHDKVNKKLICQERERYQNAKANLKKKNMSKEQLQRQCTKLKSNILKTKKSPPFERVLAMYELQRARKR